MARKNDKNTPSAKDIAEVMTGRASSGDKREMHGYAVRHPHSKAAKALKKAGYKPNYKLRKKKRKR